jgi:hypothetical protein
MAMKMNGILPQDDPLVAGVTSRRRSDPWLLVHNHGDVGRTEHQWPGPAAEARLRLGWPSRNTLSNRSRVVNCLVDLFGDDGFTPARMKVSKSKLLVSPRSPVLMSEIIFDISRSIEASTSILLRAAFTSPLTSPALFCRAGSMMSQMTPPASVLALR